MSFSVFSIVFIIILVILYFVNPIYYLMAAFIFGLHVGGCSGDLYVYILFKSNSYGSIGESGISIREPLSILNLITKSSIAYRLSFTIS